jgi:hypothetical protein
MSKSKSRTTGIPAPTKRTIDTRKYRSRAEREARNTRIVLITTGVIAALIVLILAVALLIDNVIQPNQAVASVGGQNITSREFQRRVVFERWRLGTTLASIYQQFGPQYAQQLFTDTQSSPYAQAYQQLSSPLTMGNAVLKDMTDNLVIQQYAKENNIKLDESEINKRLYDFFGYEPNPQTATPTLTPTITLTPLVSPTPTTTPTVTPVPSVTVTPTTTPLPTGIPTATPGPTEQKQQYDKNSADYYERAAKATGLSEAEVRQILIESALRDKVKEIVVGKPPDQQDQIKARHILVDTEDQARDILKALQNGESFAALAKASSKDTGSGSQGGELGWKGKGAYVPEFEAAIWSDKAKVGDVLGPIKTQYGYHIIQIEGHEMRTLTDSEKTDVQNKAFDDWLTKQRTQRNVQTYDIWQDRVPTNPTLTELGLPEGLSSGLGGAFPGGFPQ